MLRTNIAVHNGDTTYDSTWFSNDRMTGYGEVLNALSAIASRTSCRPGGQRESSNINKASQNGVTHNHVPRLYVSKVTLLAAHFSGKFYALTIDLGWNNDKMHSFKDFQGISDYLHILA